MPRKSTGTYPIDWKEISIWVKAAAGWHGERCGHPDDRQAGYMLTVHHLTLEKDNCQWWNLAALCQRCHLRTQGKVIMERPWLLDHSEWFKPHAAGYYAHRLGLPEDWQYVMDHLDDLLDMGQARRFPCPENITLPPNSSPR